MNDADLSNSTRALLRQAKSDAPGALSKAKIWGGVAATTAVGAAGGGAASATAVASGSGKLIAVGALFGSAITVGLAMLLVHVGPMAPRRETLAPLARAEGAIATPTPTPTPTSTSPPTPTPTSTLTPTTTTTYIYFSNFVSSAFSFTNEESDSLVRSMPGYLTH